MLEQFTQWLFDLVKKVFTALWDFVVDAVINLVDLVLTAIVALIGAIPVPAFMSNGLQSLFAALDPGILWVLGQCGIVTALGMVGAAYGFRLVRKVVTLFQW